MLVDYKTLHKLFLKNQQIQKRHYCKLVEN
jgi:hypothetical protein